MTFLDVLKYILLGAIQGFAEVLPISSSAHLAICNQLLNINDNSLFLEVLLHVGSLIAIIIFLWKKLINLIKGFFIYLFKRKEEYKFEFRYCLMLVVSTIIVVIFTLLLGDLIDQATSRLYIIGILLMINGIMLFFLPKIQGTRTDKEMNYLDALVIGGFECLGVFPGISRSGSCLCGAFTRKIDKTSAADYAFMLFIPACLGALVLSLVHLDGVSIDAATSFLYAIGVIVAGVTTFFSFKILLNVVKKGKLSIFSIYCLIVGLAAFIYGIIIL